MATPAVAEVKSLISAAVAEATAPMNKAIETMAASIQNLGETVKTLATTRAEKPATKNTEGLPGTGTEERATVTGGERAIKGTGLSAIRVLKSAVTIGLSRGGSGGVIPSADVAKHLRQVGYSDDAAAYENAVVRAMSQSTFADGGALVPPEYSAELISLLRNMTCIRKLGARSIPMGASLEIPTQESAATAAYVGETTAITPSTPGLGSIRLSEKKLAALVVFSNDLARNAVVSAEEFIRDDLLNVLALKEDYTALFSDGSVYTPRGLKSLVHTDNVFDATASSQTAPTLAEIKKDLAKIVRKLMEANIPMTRIGWAFSPRTWAYLWSITDSLGNSVYQAEMAQGRLMGYPFQVTNQIPNNLTWSTDGSTDVSWVFFGDFAQFLIGESMGMQMEVFPNAAYDLSGTVKSGISQDQSLIRALQKHDFQLRYQKAFVIFKTRMT